MSSLNNGIPPDKKKRKLAREDTNFDDVIVSRKRLRSSESVRSRGSFGVALAIAAMLVLSIDAPDGSGKKKRTRADTDFDNATSSTKRPKPNGDTNGTSIIGAALVPKTNLFLYFGISEYSGKRKRSRDDINLDISKRLKLDVNAHDASLPGIDVVVDTEFSRNIDFVRGQRKKL